jgi:O-acetyl-ADP-ribose deacetylase (regulator of RNase III)
VIHTVGPIVQEILTQKDCDDLEKCYRACMEAAEQNNIKSIAFCCLSTGVFGFPQKKACEIAIDTIKDCLASGSKIEKIVFNVFKPEDEKYYLEILRKV